MSDTLDLILAGYQTVEAAEADFEGLVILGYDVDAALEMLD